MIDLEYINKRITELEKIIKSPIPQEYKDYLLDLEYNFISFPKYEGWTGLEDYKVEYLLEVKPIPAYYTFNASDPECKWPSVKIINLYSLIEQKPYELINSYQRFQSETEERYLNYLPIADNGWGDTLCMGLKEDNKGKIFISAHEQDYSLIKIANSLKEFLNLSTL